MHVAYAPSIINIGHTESTDHYVYFSWCIIIYNVPASDRSVCRELHSGPMGYMSCILRRNGPKLYAIRKGVLLNENLNAAHPLMGNKYYS